MQINELYFGYTPYTKYVNEEEISLPKFKEAINKPENNFIKDITDFLSKYDEKYNKEEPKDDEGFDENDNIIVGENGDIIALKQAAEALEQATEEEGKAAKNTIETFDGLVR